MAVDRWKEVGAHGRIARAHALYTDGPFHIDIYIHFQSQALDGRHNVVT